MTPTPPEKLIPATPAKALDPERLRRRCDPKTVVLGAGQRNGPAMAQARALSALRRGLELDSKGFNIFVCGPGGTGKTATIRAVLKELAEANGDDAPPDRLYVQDFANADRPRLLTLPAGDGRRFHKAMRELVQFLPRGIPNVLEDEKFQKWRDERIARYEQDERRMLLEFEEGATERGFVLSRVGIGSISRPDLLVRMGDEAVELADVGSLLRLNGDTPPGPSLDEIEAAYATLRDELDGVLRKVRRSARELERDLEELVHREGMRVVGGLIEDVREQFPDPAVDAYLDAVQSHVLDNLELFASSEPSPPDDGDDTSADAADWMSGEDDAFRDLRVNVVVDNSDTVGRPVIQESNPTPLNLFGTIERLPEDPAHAPLDFTGLRAGALLRADGGFLVLDGPEAFLDPQVWRTLRRALKTGSLEIQPPPDAGACNLKPEPIEFSVKVIVTGDSALFQELYVNDETFRTVFKIKAEFDSELPFDEGVASYAAFLELVCDEEGLVPVTPEAVARTVEAGLREVERQDRMTSCYRLLGDWIREASLEARRAGADQISGEHVQAALAARAARHDLVAELSLADIQRGTVEIDTQGARVGQVNALTVFDYGDHQHARPCRVTAAVGAGRSGVMSVEREAKLSGRIHSKGVLVLAGLLLERFGQRRPLALTASSVFEQTYELLDGDSASLAETFAILSALSGIPLFQGVAVTGSVTQKGEVHAVGGINEKIEGFFDVCALRGLTGKQGVVVPQSNVTSLMLEDRVVDAVRAGQFHIWAVRSVDEGLEILTGFSAGAADDTGDHPPGSVNERVAMRLAQLADAAAADSWPVAAR